MTTMDTTCELRAPEGGVPIKTWTRGVPVRIVGVNAVTFATTRIAATACCC
jgi:hypothetical protein